MNWLQTTARDEALHGEIRINGGFLIWRRRVAKATAGCQEKMQGVRQLAKTLPAEYDRRASPSLAGTALDNWLQATQPAVGSR